MDKYKNIQSCVINNGLSSEYFYHKRGVRQGDPLSPYLFLLAVETLAIAIRDNEEIKGIVMINKRPNYYNMLMIQRRFSLIQSRRINLFNC